MRAPAADQTGAVFHRQTQVDNGDVRRMFLKEIIRFFRVRRRINLMPHFIQLDIQVMA